MREVFFFFFLFLFFFFFNFIKGIRMVTSSQAGRSQVGVSNQVSLSTGENESVKTLKAVT